MCVGCVYYTVLRGCNCFWPETLFLRSPSLTLNFNITDFQYRIMSVHLSFVMLVSSVLTTIIKTYLCSLMEGGREGELMYVFYLWLWLHIFLMHHLVRLIIGRSHKVTGVSLYIGLCSSSTTTRYQE